MPEGVLAPARPALRTDLRESSDLVTTLWLAGRGVYRSADDGYGRNGKSGLRGHDKTVSSLAHPQAKPVRPNAVSPANTDKPKKLLVRTVSDLLLRRTLA